MSSDIRRSLIIAGVIIFILGIVAAFVIPGFIRQRVIPAEDPKIRMLERQNDSLMIENRHLMLLEKSYLTEIDTLSKKAGEIKTKVIYLNNRKNEKIRIVDGMSDSELDEFLSNTKAN